MKNRFNVKEKFKSESCGYSKLDDSYVFIVKRSDFLKDPKKYVYNSYGKRQRQIDNEEFEIIKNLHI